MVQGRITNVTRSWFDHLETVLHAEAKLAGLLEHGTLIGNAREFFVTRVLRTVLPASLHIGTGRIIGHNGSVSNQIDVVVYDPRFPMFEVQPGAGLYIAEGVVAAIEVKSRIDKSKLWTCLDNSLSVTRIPPSVMTRSVTLNLNQMTPGPIREFPTFLPCTYVFAFQAQTNRAKSFAKWVDQWWTKNQLGENEVRNLPEIIIAGNILGLANGRWFQVGAEGELAEKIRKSNGDNAKIAVGFWEVGHPFGWLLMHLLTTCASRFSDSHKLALDKYLPVEDYWASELNGRMASMISIGPDKPASSCSNSLLTS